MLTIFRRHTLACRTTHAENGTPKDMGRGYRKCSCPLHTEGTLSGQMLRKALDTGTWTRAQAIVRDAEARGRWEIEEAPITDSLTVHTAVHSFLRTISPESTGRSTSTVRAMRSTLDAGDADYAKKCTKRTANLGLLEYCELEGLKLLKSVTVEHLIRWASAWVCSAQHRQKKIRLVRRFYYFCLRAKWVPDNIALSLETPKGRAVKSTVERVPFDKQHLPTDGPEMLRIFDAARAKGPKLYAVTCLMRYAGLRISDASTFNASSVHGDMIFLRMTKTGEPLTVPMHPRLKAALAACTPNAQGFYFWSGASNLATATDNWRARYVKLFARVGIENGYPHRFRHTFAVDLLLRGMPIDQVSTVLGHGSTKVTEKHYLAFVAARRAQLQASMLSAWGLPASPGPVAVTATQEAA